MGERGKNAKNEQEQGQHVATKDRESASGHETVRLHRVAGPSSKLDKVRLPDQLGMGLEGEATRP